jgi:hypothetical protein
MKPLVLLLALGLALHATACKCQSDKSSAPAQASPPPSIVNPRLEPIPTEEDFEEQAVREIKLENLDTELDRLEDEIKP